MENENKQMWFTSNKGGEAYDRNTITKTYIHIILWPSRNNYRCHCLDYSISYNYEQKQITQKKHICNLTVVDVLFTFYMVNHVGSFSFSIFIIEKN